MSDCSECDIDEREKQYRRHLNRQSLYESAARDLEGYWVGDGGEIVHEGITKVNTDAISYRRFAETKEEHDIEPKQFLMLVLDRARVVPLQE